MSGVNFPTPLLEAHESGELVIFVGAGASVPWPSSLPSFVKLVEMIRDESNLRDDIGDLDDQPLDEVLGRIKDDYGVDVHGRIHSHMSKNGSRPSPIHKAIVDLASASTVRVVTTNYDRHLSTLLDQHHEERAEYSAPALPMGDDFEGLVYIHGHLDQERRRLVATDDDFGKAYLTDAWAARFLDRMFAARPVLFVGYSHKDTIMKYLARGLGGRSEKRYAITADSESNLWRQLGITPIQCSYDDIAPALNDWATRASEGLLGHRARVKALVAGQDPTPTPETMSYLHSIVGGKNTVRFFTQHARGKLWLRWAAATPEFATLFYPSPNVETNVTHELARWFAQNYVTDDELSDVALQIVAEANTNPGSDLLFEICRRLAGTEWPLPERLRRWLLIVTCSPGTNHTTSFLGSMLRRSSLTDDPNTALFLFDYLTEPKVRPSHQIIFGSTFETASRESDIALSDIWEQGFRPALEGNAVRLLDIADRHLRRADLQLAIANESDRRRPSDWRAAIEHLGIHELSGPLGFLIDAARECIDYLVEAGHPDGFARLDTWATSNITLLQRLAVHGWTRRTDKTASEKLRWFMSSGWLTAYEIRSETTYLISQAVPSAESDAIAALIASIVEHSDDDEFAPRRAWSLLTTIDAARPGQENVKQALANLSHTHPEVEDRLREESKTEPSAWETAPPTNIEELHEEIGRDAAATGQAIIACEAESSSFDDQRRWDAVTGAISATVQSWPEDPIRTSRFSRFWAPAYRSSCRTGLVHVGTRHRSRRHASSLESTL